MSAPVPRILRWLLRLAAPASEREWLLSDLDEEAAARARAHGDRDARRWSRRQILTSLGPLLLRRTEALTSRSWRSPMNMWRGLRSDLLLAVRRLWDTPGFTAICIATLALGIGGNTAVFTLIDRVLLQPLPVRQPADLYRLGDGYTCCVNDGLQGSFSLFSYDLYSQLKEAAPEFSELAAFQATTRAITIGPRDESSPGESLDSAFVSGNYFSMLGIVPAAGRFVEPTDDRPGAPPVAVISYRAWSQRFQKRADVIGTPMLLNGVAGTVVGVAPEGFYGETLRPDPADIWVPLAHEPQLEPAAQLLRAKSTHWLYIIGRLKPDAAIAPLEQRLTARLQQWIGDTMPLPAADRSRVPQQYIKVVSASAGVASMRDEVRPSLKLLQAVAAAVLLIACANLANLLLVRGMARRTETAVRAALGATRSRLLAQFLTESIVLSCAGGLAGLIVAYAGARAIIELTFRGAANVPVDPAPSPTVILFALAVAAATALTFGGAPALIGSRSNPIEAMRGAGRSTAERGSKLRQSLIALQVALSLVLITCAGLLARSLDNLQRQDFGFRADHLYVAALAPSLATTPAHQLEGVYARSRERLQRIPGVEAAAFALYAPMSGDNWSSRITVEGHATSERLVASWDRITPGYFATVGTPVVRGRTFDDRDRPDAPLVAIVSTSFARRFFGDADPIGRRIGFTSTVGTGEPRFEIVGIVGDARYQDGRRPPNPTFYLPFLQQGANRQSWGPGATVDRSHFAAALMLRTRGPATDLERHVRAALGEVDRRIIIRTFRPMDEQVAGHFNLERLIARLTGAFGSVALLLACLGIYGVTAYSVTRRTREIGIRMAIGATRPRVLGIILRGTVIQLALGIALGIPVVYATGRLLRSTLFGVSAGDPLAIGGGLAILAVATAIAALVPARRAASLDPVRALRVD